MNPPLVSSRTSLLALVGALALSPALHADTAAGDLLAHWRFEQIQPLQGEPTPSTVGQPLTAGDRGPTGPQPFAFDDSGKGNLLQVRGSRPSPNVFSDDVPAAEIDGKPNTRSLALKRGEYFVTFDRPLPYYDLRQNWTIKASLRCNLLGTEQVYLCKEGPRGQLAADVSLGFDNMQKRYFVELTGADGKPYRITAGEEVEAGKWYDVRASATFDAAHDRTTLKIEVKSSSEKSFGLPGTLALQGPALPRLAGQWVIGRGYPGGFPNSLHVLDGAIDEVRIRGEAPPRVSGQNPIFTETFTADPRRAGDR